MANYSWGYGTSDAPYYLQFTCYEFERLSKGRVDPANLLATFIMPGVKITRGSAHRYSEDSTMNENLAQALGTIDDEFALSDVAGTDTVGDIVNKSQKLATNIAARHQQDNFGHINSTLGRLELLTTEAAFLGSTKRRYNFFWNLKSTDYRTADSARAAEVGEAFEKYSLPVVGQYASSLTNATRMAPPSMWRIEALDFNGDEDPTLNRMWLGVPKMCVMMQAMHAIDNQSFIAEGNRAAPFSYNIALNFIEMENVLYNSQTEQIQSRSEFFTELGGG